MPFSALTNLATGDLVTETEYDKIKNNFDYILLPNGEQILHSEAGTYTTTSTSFVDIDATDLSIDITTYGGRILIYLQCLAESSANVLYFDFTVDGTRVGQAFTAGLCALSANKQWVTVFAIVDKTADTYTIVPQWRQSAAGTGTIQSSSTIPVNFGAFEIF